MIDLSLGHWGPQTVVHCARAVRPRAEYGAPLGIPALRSALAEHLGVAMECVAVTGGATAGLTAAVVADGRPEVLVTPSPGYPGYKALAKLLDVPVISYDFDSAEKFEHAIVGSVRRTVAIWNSPHNPTGRIEDAADINMLDRLAHQDMPIIEDRVYEQLHLPEHAIARAVGNGSNVIVGSLSKILALAGERIGFVVADPQRLVSVMSAAWRLSMSVSSASQQVALQSLNDPGLGEQIAARRLHRVEALKIARTALDLPPTPVDDPYFVWLTFPRSTESAEAIATACRDRGVIVASGQSFDSAVPAIRLSLTSVPLEELTVALSAVTAALIGLGLNSTSTHR